MHASDRARIGRRLRAARGPAVAAITVFLGQPSDTIDIFFLPSAPASFAPMSATADATAWLPAASNSTGGGAGALGLPPTRTPCAATVLLAAITPAHGALVVATCSRILGPP